MLFIPTKMVQGRTTSKLAFMLAMIESSPLDHGVVEEGWSNESCFLLDQCVSYTWGRYGSSMNYGRTACWQRQCSAGKPWILAFIWMSF